MARTESTMLALGTIAPTFSLPDTVSNIEISLGDVQGKIGTVVMFICNHCPFVLHVNSELTKLANDYMPLGFGFIAISSNDIVNYPQDRPELMTEVAKRESYPFAYVYDATQIVATNYKAACTPDFYLFDAGLELVYRGQLDDSRPGNGIPLTGKDLREAMDAVVEKRPAQQHQKPSIGCNIKWKT